MNDLQIFKNEQFGEIRTVIINNEPYFVGKDSAEILGYKDTNQAIRNHVDDEDKLTRSFYVSGQMREMMVINESGLYSLVFGSKLSEAKKFKRWITHEVIPSIRKTGIYSIGTEKIKNQFKQKEVEAKLNNSRVRLAQTWLKIADS